LNLSTRDAPVLAIEDTSKPLGFAAVSDDNNPGIFKIITTQHSAATKWDVAIPGKDRWSFDDNPAFLTGTITILKWIGMVVIIGTTV
jgi:hypothetical protein